MSFKSMTIIIKPSQLMDKKVNLLIHHQTGMITHAGGEVLMVKNSVVENPKVERNQEPPDVSITLGSIRLNLRIFHLPVSSLL